MTLVPSSGLAFWLVARQRPVFGQGWPASWQAAERVAGQRASTAGRVAGQLGAGRGGPALGWLEVQAYTHRLRHQGQPVFVAHASDNGFGQGLNVGSASIATVGDGQDVHG